MNGFIFPASTSGGEQVTLYGYFPILCLFSTINASWDCTVVHCFSNVLGEGLVEISFLLVTGENTHFKII